VTFGCENPAAYDTNDHYHVRLLIPRRQPAARWPTMRPDGRINWPSGADELIQRVYTIRSVDLIERTVTVDFIRHGDDTAPGAAFARNACPGDCVGALGPGGRGLPDAERIALFGDETALPAIARILENLPPQATAEVFLEIEHGDEEQPLCSPAITSITWIHRNRNCRTSSDGLRAKFIEYVAEVLKDGQFVWVGCEKSLATEARQVLPAPRSRSLVVGYWAKS
jgi:NADPH-dependent ferric siderophore reductase